MKIEYHVKQTSLIGILDACYLRADDDPAYELVESVVSTISTNIQVGLGEHTVHLAMLQDPDHWADDWEELGIEDVDEFIASLVVES